MSLEEFRHIIDALKAGKTVEYGDLKMKINFSSNHRFIEGLTYEIYRRYLDNWEDKLKPYECYYEFPIEKLDLEGNEHERFVCEGVGDARSVIREALMSGQGIKIVFSKEYLYFEKIGDNVCFSCQKDVDLRSYAYDKVYEAVLELLINREKEFRNLQIKGGTELPKEILRLIGEYF